MTHHEDARPDWIDPDAPGKPVAQRGGWLESLLLTLVAWIVGGWRWLWRR